MRISKLSYSDLLNELTRAEEEIENLNDENDKLANMIEQLTMMLAEQLSKDLIKGAIEVPYTTWKVKKEDN